MNSRDFQDRLMRRARRAGVGLPSGVAERLETYYRLLSAWNVKINLSGIDLSDATPDAIDRLLVEPVLAARFVPVGPRRMIDIGSGGGSPAIPMALAAPGVRLLMVESKTRKSVFLREAIRALEMEADVVTSRFEALLTRPDLHEASDLLTVRAVRVEARVLMSLQAFVKPGGLVFLFRNTDGETADAPPLPLRFKATYPLIEPLRSTLVVLEKKHIGVRR